MHDAADVEHSFEVVTQDRQAEFSGYFLQAFEQEVALVHRQLDRAERMLSQLLALFEQGWLTADSFLQTFQHVLMNPAPQLPPPLRFGALRAQRTCHKRSCDRGDTLYRDAFLQTAKGQLCALGTNIEVAGGVVTELGGGKHSASPRRPRLREREISGNADRFALLELLAIEVTAIAQDGHVPLRPVLA